MRRNRHRDNLAPHPPIQLVWSPEDSAIVLRDFERHAADAIALTRGIEAAKAVHPATLSKKLDRSGRAPTATQPCEVIDLFTRTRAH